MKKSTPLHSPSDHRQYAAFTLANGLRVLLVSHMPLVSFLVETFTKSGNTPIFDTAAIACLHYEVGQTGVLLEKTSPAELALNAHR